MTDINPPRITLCEGFPGIEGCHNYIPADIEGRSAHRRWHIHEDKVREALREANKTLQTQVRELTATIARIQQDVEGIEIPEPIEPLTILTAEDLEELPDDEETIQASQYADSPDETALAATTVNDSDHTTIVPAPTTPTSINPSNLYRPGFMQ